jgi:hypothetical protein
MSGEKEYQEEWKIKENKNTKRIGPLWEKRTPRGLERQEKNTKRRVISRKIRIVRGLERYGNTKSIRKSRKIRIPRWLEKSRKIRISVGLESQRKYKYQEDWKVKENKKNTKRIGK